MPVACARLDWACRLGEDRWIGGSNVQVLLGKGDFDTAFLKPLVDGFMESMNGLHAVVHLGEVSAHDEVQGTVAELFEGHQRLGVGEDMFVLA